MGRKSLAKKIYEQVKEDYGEEGGTWLVLYDFKGVKASSKFWTNMKLVAVSRLAEHYGGETLLYRAERVDLK